MSTRPLKPTIANVTRVLNNANLSPLGMQRAGLAVQPGHTNEIVAVHYNRPMGARHATADDLDRWFAAAAEALAPRSLTLTRVGPHVAVVKAT